MVGCDWMELKFQQATDSLTSIPKEDPCWSEGFCDSDSGKDVNKLLRVLYWTLLSNPGSSNSLLDGY